jgi:hypothetical protein
MADGLFVQRLRRHVNAVGPRDRPGLDADLGEERLIGKRLEDTAPLVLVEGDVANRAVPKPRRRRWSPMTSTRVTSTIGSGASVMRPIGVATPHQLPSRCGSRQAG